MSHSMHIHINDLVKIVDSIHNNTLGNDRQYPRHSSARSPHSRDPAYLLALQIEHIMYIIKGIVIITEVSPLGTFTPQHEIYISNGDMLKLTMHHQSPPVPHAIIPQDIHSWTLCNISEHTVWRPLTMSMQVHHTSSLQIHWTMSRCPLTHPPLMAGATKSWKETSNINYIRKTLIFEDHLPLYKWHWLEDIEALPLPPKLDILSLSARIN